VPPPPSEEATVAADRMQTPPIHGSVRDSLTSEFSSDSCEAPVAGEEGWSLAHRSCVRSSQPRSSRSCRRAKRITEAAEIESLIARSEKRVERGAAPAQRRRRPRARAGGDAGGLTNAAHRRASSRGFWRGRERPTPRKQRRPLAARRMPIARGARCTLDGCIGQEEADCRVEQIGALRAALAAEQTHLFEISTERARATQGAAETFVICLVWSSRAPATSRASCGEPGECRGRAGHVRARRWSAREARLIAAQHEYQLAQVQIERLCRAHDDMVEDPPSWSRSSTDANGTRTARRARISPAGKQRC